MTEYFNSKYLPDKFAVIRHDVDRLPGNSLETSRIESELGMKATYYFRAIQGDSTRKIVKQVVDYGHEVGYHYEVLSDAKGDYSKAIKLFEKNLSELRKICDVTTISMHGSPLSKYDNRDIWKNIDFHKFGILGEAYLSVGKELNYFSDTGRNWSSKKNKIRDFIPGKNDCILIKNTFELIDLIDNGKLDNIYILSHPERWSYSLLNWSFYFGWDFAVNFMKKGIITIRKSDSYFNAKTKESMFKF